MTIDAIENYTKVTIPTGQIGRVKVTRRERQLISDGKLSFVDVLCSDGITRKYNLAELVEVEIEKPECCQCCGRCS